MVLASKTGLALLDISAAAVQINAKTHEFEFESVFESSAHVDSTYFLLVSDLIGKPAST